MATDKPVVILGAGPSGLTAAWQLTRQGQTDVLVLEAHPTQVGGNARTHVLAGYRIDVGGHQFQTRSTEIKDIWNKIMPNELLQVDLSAHILHGGKYYAYPLRVSDVLIKLGPFESITLIFSYLQKQLFPKKPEKDFAAWVSNRFGTHFYKLFFKDYTEKMWGVSCENISAEWAAQRIHKTSFLSVLRDLIFGAHASKTTFFYPRLGPGQMWEKATEQILAAGGQVIMDFKVQTVHWDEEGVSHVTGTTSQGGFYQQEGITFISTLPLKELLLSMDPPPPKPVLAAAHGLRYRDYITVVLVVNQAKVFSETCLYINDASVQVSRIQNYKNFSPTMVPDKNKTTLGLEYFCFENDGLWSADDQSLAELAAREAVQLKLVRGEDLLQAFVIRTPKAYPIYDHGYANNVATIREWLNYFPNLQPVGRNGLHRYSNQDHSMMTAVLATRNLHSARRTFDCWEVGPHAEYQPLPEA